jgi:hypothetical protein
MALTFMLTIIKCPSVSYIICNVQVRAVLGGEKANLLADLVNCPGFSWLMNIFTPENLR